MNAYPRQLAALFADPKHQEWEFIVKGITCDSQAVAFPELFQPMALALANDGALMVADSGTRPRQQVLFYDVTNPAMPKLTRNFGERGGIRSGTPGEIMPKKLWGIPGLGMDAVGNCRARLHAVAALHVRRAGNR